MRTREKVVTLRKEGKSIKEIAKTLDINVSTVKYHLKNADVKYHFPKSEKKPIILKLKAEGKSIKEIAEITGFNIETIRYHYNQYGIRRKKKGKGQKFNEDRHLCKTCRFRDENGTTIWCFYFAYTDKERREICSVEECTVYEKGDPGPIKVVE